MMPGGAFWRASVFEQAQCSSENAWLGLGAEGLGAGWKSRTLQPIWGRGQLLEWRLSEISQADSDQGPVEA